MTPASKSRTGATSKKTPATIPELIAALASPSPVARRKARDALVALGKPAVPSLIQLLSHRKLHVRWEAAKALGGIADPIAASALVNALDDRDGDVRWLAAEGLAVLEQSEPEVAAPAAAYTALSRFRDLPPATATSLVPKSRKP